MINKYKPDEKPFCPACGKSLDEGPARDYVVWRVGSELPYLTPQTTDCGWCDAILIVTPRILPETQAIEISFQDEA
jgi:hypothetical protein